MASSDCKCGKDPDTDTTTKISITEEPNYYGTTPSSETPNSLNWEGDPEMPPQQGDMLDIPTLFDEINSVDLSVSSSEGVYNSSFSNASAEGNRVESQMLYPTSNSYPGGAEVLSYGTVTIDSVSYYTDGWVEGTDRSFPMYNVTTPMKLLFRVSETYSQSDGIDLSPVVTASSFRYVDDAAGGWDDLPPSLSIRFPLGRVEYNGRMRSAGYLTLGGSMDTNLPAPANLDYVGIWSDPEETSTDVEIVVDSGSRIRRVITPAYHVEVVPKNPATLSGGTEFWLEYYSDAPTSGDPQDGDNACTYDSGDLVKRVKVEDVTKPTVDYSDGVQVTEERDPATDAVSKFWQLTSGQGHREDRDGRTTDVASSTMDGNNQRVETTTVSERGDITSLTVRDIEGFEFDSGNYNVEEVIAETRYADPETPAGGEETIWTYNTSGTPANDYKRVDRIEYPDGRWVEYDYDDYGNILWMREPYKDSVWTNAEIRKTSYGRGPLYDAGSGEEWYKFPQVYLWGRATYVNTTIVKSETWVRLGVSLGTDDPLVEITHSGLSSSWNEVRVWEEYLQLGGAAADPALSGRVSYDEDASGGRITYDYVLGDWNNTNDSFTPNSSGLAMKTTATEGTSGSPGGIDDKTTQTITYTDEHGRVQMVETKICTDAGTPAYSLATTEKRDYDEYGRLTEIERDGRIVQEYEFTSDLETVSIDEAGVKTIHERDAQGRMYEITQTGLSGVVPDLITTYTYDGLTTSVNRGGLVSTTERDGLGRVVSQTDETGAETSFTHVVATRTTTRTDPGGVTQITERHRDGRVESVTGTGVVPTYYQYSFSASGETTKTYTGVDPGSGGLRYRQTLYDRMGRISVVTFPDPDLSGTQTLTYTYNASNQLVKIDSSATDVADVLYEYDSLGRVSRTGLDQTGNGTLDTASADPIVDTDRVFFQDTGLWWERVTTKTYYHTDGSYRTDKAEQRLSANAGGYASASRIIPATGDEVETLTSITRTDSVRQMATYVTSDSAGLTAWLTENGLRTMYIEPHHTVVTTYQYDDLWRLLKTTDSRGAITWHGYNHVGQYARRTDHLGNTTGYEYYGPTDQNAGKLSVVRNPEGEKTVTTYDAVGRVSAVSGDGTYRREYDYDEYGALEELTTYRTYPGTSDTTTWIYDDASGVLKEKQYDDGKGPQYTYDNAGRLKTRVWERSSGITTTYTYNNLSQLTSVDYPNDTDITYSYHRDGQVNQITDASGTRSHTYNATSGLPDQVEYTAGLLDDVVIEEDYNGDGERTDLWLKDDTTTKQRWTYGYDAYGRISEVKDITAEIDYDYTYEPTSLMVHELEASDVSGSPALIYLHTYEHDRLGRVTGVINEVPDGGGERTESSVGYVYDRAGRRTRATREDARHWRYDYNSRGEVVSAKKYTDSDDIMPGLQFEYDYDDIGNRKTAKYGGDLNGANLNTITYTANGLNQYSAVVTPGVVTVVGEADSGNANSISVDSGGGTGSADRIQDFFGGAAIASNSSGPVWDSSVSIDQTGETSGSGAVFHPKNSVSVGGGELSYDDDGNLTKDARWEYQWNDEGRLKLVQTNSAAESAGVPYRKYEFLYDNYGRRVCRKAYSGTSGSPSLDRTDYFIWRGWTLLAEITASWGEELYYTQGLDLASSLTATGNVGSFLGIREVDGGTTTAFPHYDGNGNVLSYTQADGTMLMSREYDAFGNTVLQRGASVNGRLSLPWFSSKIQDEETGLYYYGYRYYDPETGRWMSRDPLEEAAGHNLYSFVNNSPSGWLDKLGLTLAPINQEALDEATRRYYRDRDLPDRRHPIDYYREVMAEMGLSADEPADVSEEGGEESTILADPSRCSYLQDVGNKQYVLMLITRKAYSDRILLKGVKMAARAVSKKAMQEILETSVSAVGGIASLIDQMSLPSMLGTFQAQILGFYRCCICEEPDYVVKWSGWKFYSDDVYGSGIGDGRDVYTPHLSTEFKNDFEAAVERAMDSISSLCSGSDE